MKMQIQFCVFFRFCTFFLESVFYTNLGLNRNCFCLTKVLTVTALLPKFCSHSLCAKLLTSTGKEKAQICKDNYLKFFTFSFSQPYYTAVNLYPAFTIFSFQINVIFKEYTQLTNVENETLCPKDKVNGVMRIIYFRQLTMCHQP